MRRWSSVLCVAAGILSPSISTGGESCSHRILIRIIRPQVFEVRKSAEPEESGVTASLTWQAGSESRKVTVSTSPDPERKESSLEILVTEPDQAGRSDLFIPAGTPPGRETNPVVAYTITDAN
ncbi:MAG TPA: hypothetical protein ENN17_02300 [bacterium]|nr:hypothetical protein [bacterium]